MKIETFQLERDQSLWENLVAYNLTESGLHPFTLSELFSAAQLDELLSLRLGYGQTNGSIPLRQAISSYYPGATADSVLATNGSAEANFLANWTQLEPGDEIVYMVPNYMQIWGVARALGVTVKPLPLRQELGWQPDLNELRQLVSPKTKVIAVCNPNNPTGSRLSSEAMAAIVAAAQEVGAWIFSDEVYRGAELDEVETRSFWGMTDKVVVTAGLSKAYGLPGLRLGWLVGPAEFIAQCWASSDYTTITPGILSDRAGTFVLGDRAMRNRILTRNRGWLRQNLALVQEWVAEQNGRLSLTPPQAGGMAFMRYDFALNSTELTTRLRQEQSVLVVAGDCFGMDGHLRFGFGSEPEYLTAGLNRVAAFLRTIR